jgi:uncharacterized membrane protein YgcG
MKTTLLCALALVGVAMWIFGLMSTPTLLGFAQIVLAAATLMFFVHLVQRRRQRRATAGRPRHAPPGLGPVRSTGGERPSGLGGGDGSVGAQESR